MLFKTEILSYLDLMYKILKGAIKDLLKKPLLISFELIL